MDVIHKLELEQMKRDIPRFSVGDTVRVGYQIREGNKERIQYFQGTVIAVRGSGLRRTMKVRRIVAGEGVERTFPLHSPKLSEIEVMRMGKVRRAKLYYLRSRVGKATRVKQIFGKTYDDPTESSKKDAPSAEAS
ncbi:MAG: 50S ribosomal protein L19 [Planctomycetes bacterium]|nr:50S ribosomal protein L19 [Planctomycetota bacterium]MCB9917270.1 50S ribosomal protein L19 [Planctomycetota bacterium]